MDNDPTYFTTERYNIWERWINDDIFATTELNILSIIVNFPTDINKT